MSLDSAVAQFPSDATGITRDPQVTRVLVIDDSNTIRRSAEIFLKQGGCEVVLAEGDKGGKDALGEVRVSVEFEGNEYSGRGLSQDVVDAAASPDPALQRSIETPVLRGDNTKLRAATGWAVFALLALGLIGQCLVQLGHATTAQVARLHGAEITLSEDADGVGNTFSVTFPAPRPARRRRRRLRAQRAGRRATARKPTRSRTGGRRE